MYLNGGEVFELDYVFGGQLNVDGFSFLDANGYP